VLDVAVDQLLEIERLGPAAVDGELVDGEGGLQRGHLVELVDDDLGDGVALELDDDARAFVRFVAHVGDVGELLFVDQRGDALDQLGAVHVEGNFRDDDLLLAALGHLGVELGADLDAAAARLEIALDAFHAESVQPVGKSGPLMILHQLRRW
jgi:hypothetical protein